MYIFLKYTFWKYTIIVLLGLTVALLFNLPLRHALPYVQLPSSMKLAGVDGTVLEGKVSELRISDFPLRKVRYSYMPSCIRMLKICYHVVYNRGEMRLAYDLLNGDSEVSRTVVEYPVAEVLTLLPDEVPENSTGRLQLRIDDLSVQADKLVSVNGKIIWKDLGLNDTGIRTHVGDYQVEFRGDPKSYKFTFSDLDATLDVRGGGHIGANGLYRVDVTFENDAGIEPHLKSVLNVAAVRAGVNKYRVNQKGRVSSDFKQQLFRLPVY